MAGKRQRPASPAGTFKGRIQVGKTWFMSQYRRLVTNWHGLSKGQKYMTAAVVLLLGWTLVLQVRFWLCPRPLPFNESAFLNWKSRLKSRITCSIRHRSP